MAIAIECQTLGLLALFMLALMELYLDWFSSQFFWLVPLVLIAEEGLVAKQTQGKPAQRSMEITNVLTCFAAISGLTSTAVKN